MKAVKAIQHFPRWLLISFAIETILILLGGYWILHITEQRYRRDAEGELLAVAQMKSKQIADWRMHRVAEGSEIMNSPFLIRGVFEWMRTRVKDFPLAFTKRFGGLQQSKVFEDVLLVDSSGQILLSLTGTTGQIDDEVLASVAVSRREKKPQIADLHISALSKSPRMDIGVPLFLNADPKGFLGSIVLVIDPAQFLYPLIQTWPIPSRTSETVLIRREGDRVLYLNDVNRLSGTALTFTMPLSRYDLPAAMAVSGKRGIFEGKDYRGVEVIAALEQVPDSPWSIESKVDKAEAFEGMWISRTLIIFLMFGLLAASIAVTVVFWQQEQKTKQREAYEAEIERLALKKHFEHLVKYANDIILLVDEHHHIVEANDRALEAYGYALEEILQMSLEGIIAPVSYPIFQEKCQKLWEQGSCLVEMIHRRKDGTEFPVEVSARSMSVESIQYIQAIIRDITERKRAEEELRESENRSRLLADAAFEGIAIHEHGIILEANRALCSLFGYGGLDEVIGKSALELAAPESRDLVALNIRSGIQEPYEAVGLRKDGTRFRGELRGSPLPYKGRVVRATAIRDITERKHAEEELSALTLRQQALLAAVPDIIMQVDNNKVYTWANKAGIDFFGNDVIGKEASYYFEGAQDTYDAVHPLFMGDENIVYVESWQRRKDGEKRLLAWWCRVLKDSSGNVSGALSSARDITERKRAEEMLQENEERFRHVSSTTSDIAYSCVTDENGAYSIDWMTGAVERITGYSMDELKAKQCWGTLVVDEDLDCFKKHVTGLLPGSSGTCELRLRRKNGEVVWVTSLAKCAKELRHPNRFILYGGLVDITERKRAEKEISMLASALKSINECVSITDMDDTILFVNHSFLETYGYREDELLGKNMNIVRSPNRPPETIGSILSSTLRGEWQGEIWNRRKDGTEFPIFLSTTIVRGEDAQPVALIGIATDITERKRAEEALVEREKRYRTLFDLSPAGIVLEDTAGNILDVNDSLCRMLGYSREDLIGHNVRVLVPTHLHGVVDSHIADILSGKVLDHEVENVGKDGSIHRMELRETLVSLPGNKQGILVVSTDITERKRVEERSEMLAHALRSITECVSVTDLDDRFIFVNDGFCKTYGYEPRELLGKHVAMLRSPNTDPGVYSSLLQETREGGWHGEMLNLKKDGTEFPISLSTTIIRGENAEPIALIGIATDITERKRAEEALKESEERFRTIFEQAAVGVALVNTRTGQFVRINQKYCEFVGYTMQEMLQKTFMDVTYYEDIQTNIEKNAELIEGKIKDYSFEKRYVRKDGSVVWGNLTISPLWKAGEKTGNYFHIAIVQDITERKEAEEERIKAQKALKESEEQFRTLFENATVGIYRTTPDGKIVLANPALIAMLGFSSFEELASRNLEAESFAVGYPREQFRKQIESAGEIRGLESVWRRKDGGSMFVVESARTIRDDAGRVLYYEGIVEDVTRKKTLEQQFLHMQRMESIGTLAGGVAHDFNNILGIIMGHSSVIARVPQDSPQFPLSIDAITKATQRGASLVKQMLTFARKTETVFEPVLVNNIVVETARLLRETFPKTIILTLDIDEGLPWVIADSTQLHQVLLNLCVNARDAMPAGGTLVISTSTVDAGRLTTKPPQTDSSEFVLLRVTDSGMGMDEATKQKIFEPFFTTKGPGLGTGLGLSLVYGIITSHDGFVEVESEVGRGTTFNVYLPVRQRDLVVEGDTEENVEDVPGGNETILLIEDEELLSDMLKVVLENKGYTVLVARDGEEGVSAYSAHRKEIDVVICDFGLPKLEGDMVLKKIRSMNPEAKVILASGFIEPGTKSDLEKAGAKCFVQKPYGANEVLGIVRKTIDMKE